MLLSGLKLVHWPSSVPWLIFPLLNVNVNVRDGLKDVASNADGFRQLIRETFGDAADEPTYGLAHDEARCDIR